MGSPEVLTDLNDRISVKYVAQTAEQGVYNSGRIDFKPRQVSADNLAAWCKERYAQKVLLRTTLAS